MARVQRLHIRRGIYYVQLRVNGDGPLFPAPEDRRVFESLVARALGRFGAQLHAYAWLPTSANLLIQIGYLPLGRIIQGIAGPYARVVNKRLGQRGHRFEHPHRARPLQPGEVLEVVGDLHRMVLELEPEAAVSARSLSSHSAYLGERMIPWLTRELVHEQLRARGLTVRAGYRKFIRELESTVLTVRMRGNQEAAGRDANEELLMRRIVERARPPRVSLPELVDSIAKQLGVDPNELRSISRRRYLSFGRAVTAWYATHGRISTLTGVAQHFGRDLSSLSVGITRYQREKPEYFLDSLDEFLRGSSRKVANRKVS